MASINFRITPPLLPHHWGPTLESPYWIDGIRYPKLQGVGVIGVCADFGQSWDLFDRTWRSIFGELGWKERGIIHAPRFMEHAETYLRTAREFGKQF